MVGSEVGSWFGLKKKKKGQEARIFQIFGDQGSPLNVVSKNDRLEAFVDIPSETDAIYFLFLFHLTEWRVHIHVRVQSSRKTFIFG